MIKTKEDIKLLSEVWEIKSKQQEITDKFYCCKIKVEKKDIIIYFNEPGFAISHDSITNAQKAPLTATVESNVPQAAFMEYGTSRIIPRRHFNNTAKRNQNKVRDFVQSKIKSAI